MVQMSLTDSAFELKGNWIVAVEALQNNEVREESFIDLALNVHFHNCEVSELSYLQYPRYNSLLVRDYMICNLRNVAYLVKVLVKPCILSPYRFLGLLNIIRILADGHKLESSYNFEL